LVRAHCIQEIAVHDRAEGDALFTAASEQCKAELLEIGAWDDFSPTIVAPWIAMLEEESRYPVTTPRGEQALAYLAENYPERAVATHREKLNHAVFGSPAHNQSFQFLAQCDRRWLADWILDQLAGGRRVPMNSAEILQELVDPKSLLAVLDQVLSAESDEAHARERALGTLVRVGQPDVLSRCVSEWVRLHREFEASTPQSDAPIRQRVTEIETALSNASVAPLVAALLAADNDIRGAAALASAARLVASAFSHSGEDDLEAATAADARTLVVRWVTRAVPVPDPHGHLNSTLIHVIESCGDPLLRPQLDQLLEAERSRRLAALGATVPVPIPIRVLAGQQWMNAVRKLAGADALDALLPMLEKELFDLAAAQQLVDELDERAGRPNLRTSNQIDWVQVAERHKNLQSAPLSVDEQRVLTALDRRLSQIAADGNTANVQARATLESLRARIVGYVREDALLAVPLHTYSMHTMVQWAMIFIRRGILIPARWPERMLGWLASDEARQRLPQDELARSVIGCVTALLFSDNTQLAGGRVREVCGEGAAHAIIETLLVPIAISGIADQISLLIELMPRQAQDSYWWAWRQAFQFLSREAQIRLCEALLSSAVPQGLRDVVLQNRERDLSAMLAESVEASPSLRRAVEALMNSDDASMRQFGLAPAA
jgi:hypothetical protein